MIALVTPTNFTVLSDTLIRVEYDARLSWNGVVFGGRAQWNLSAAMSQLAATVKAQVIAYAASVAGGQVSLTPPQVIIAGWGDDQITGARKASDSSTTSTAFSDVPGLSVLLAPSSHYKFKFKGAYTTAVNTTALQLSVNGPASPIMMRAGGIIYTTPTAPFVFPIAAYDATANPATGAGASALLFEVEGTISTNSAGGPLALRFRSEVNASAVTILTGSFVELVAVG